MFLMVLSFSLFSMQSFAQESAVDQNISDKSYIDSSKNIKYDSVEDIDKKINELEVMKRGYEAKSIKQANQAQRLQFIQGELQTAKRYWKASEDNKKIAIRIQKEIDELKIERMKLQKKKG